MIRRLLLLLTSLFLAAPAFAQGGLSPEARTRAYASSFEVVVPKPEQDPLRYEKDLPWASLPFNIRNDKYYSIGTAFAVSRTELLTAFHVMDLHLQSLTFPKLFIRDKAGHVTEVDQILQADQARDVVRFTVKGKPFAAWLPLEPAYDLNQPVYTMGNAYGEGLVLRKGDLIGTIPEAESGRWNLLRSSADVNAGNSGGPMLDAQGRAIGIVLARKDNISISLPASEIQAMKASTAVYHRKTGYSFALVPERVDLVDNDFQIQLPLGYAELRARAVKEGYTFYERRMGELFAQAPDQFMPKGEASHEAVLHIPNTTGVEIWFKNKDTKKWGLSGLEYKSHEAGGEARVFLAGAAGMAFGVVKPERASDLPELYTHPRAFMDLFLKGINYPREMGGQQIRITSLGEPVASESMKDGLGRPWRLHLWVLPHLDQYVAVYTAPVPRGVAFVLKQMPTASLDEWRYDMRRILDLVYLPYSGEIRQWGPFLSMGDELPVEFRTVKVDLDPSSRLSVATPWVAFEVRKEDLDLDPQMNLNLGMGYVWRGESVAWELRRVYVSSVDGDGWMSLLRHLKPTPSMTDAYQRAWKEVVKRRHPYTGLPFTEEGATCIATILDLGLAPGASLEQASGLYTLYLSKAGAQPEPLMKQTLKHLGDQHRIPAGSGLGVGR